jgi:hypothetical protein
MPDGPRKPPRQIIIIIIAPPTQSLDLSIWHGPLTAIRRSWLWGRAGAAGSKLGGSCTPPPLDAMPG